MTYWVVNVARASSRSAGTVGPERYTCVDGSLLEPGAYATVVVELPPSQAPNGSSLARGYYAVFWPMDLESPIYDARPQYFGPFASRALADALIFEVSSGTERSYQAPPRERRAHHGQVRRLPIAEPPALAAGREPAPSASA